MPIEIRLIWRSVHCRLRHDMNFRNNPGWSRIVIEVVHPKGHPLPIAENGICDHQLATDDLIAAGGVLRYVTQWLDREAIYPRYARALQIWKQYDLFGGGCDPVRGRRR